MTPLHASIAAGYPALVGALLELGANIDQAALDGRVPLMLAASHADVSFVSSLPMMMLAWRCFLLLQLLPPQARESSQPKI